MAPACLALISLLASKVSESPGKVCTPAVAGFLMRVLAVEAVPPAVTPKATPLSKHS